MKRDSNILRTVALSTLAVALSVGAFAEDQRPLARVQLRETAAAAGAPTPLVAQPSASVAVAEPAASPAPVCPADPPRPACAIVKVPDSKACPRGYDTLSCGSATCVCLGDSGSYRMQVRVPGSFVLKMGPERFWFPLTTDGWNAADEAAKKLESACSCVYIRIPNN